MKITDIETIYVDRYLFVKIHTDAGLRGWANRALGDFWKHPRWR